MGPVYDGLLAKGSFTSKHHSAGSHFRRLFLAAPVGCTAPGNRRLHAALRPFGFQEPRLVLQMVVRTRAHGTLRTPAPHYDPGFLDRGPALNRLYRLRTPAAPLR